MFPGRSIGDDDIYYLIDHALNDGIGSLPTFIGDMQCLAEDTDARGDIAWILRDTRW